MFRIALITAVLAPTLAVAQDTEPDVETREIRYKQRTEIIFDGVGVNGEIVKPSGTIVTERVRPVFNPLIELRKTFDSEMKQSIDEVK